MTARVRGGALVAFSLNRPVTVAMGVVALLVLGVIANAAIPIELIPSGFTPPFLYVEVPTLRSAPPDVEEEVAAPVEEMLATVPGVSSLSTRVDAHSASFFIELADDTNMDLAYNQVRDRVDRVLPTLDDPIGRYFVWKYNPADEPVMWFAVTFPPDGDAHWTVENVIAARIERVPGVSRVESFGVPDRVVGVRVRDRAARAAGLGVEGVVRRFEADNFSVAAGTMTAGGARVPVRVTSRFTTIDEIAALPLPGGGVLSDIATVAVQDRSERAVYRVDRAPSVFLAVYKESTANTVDVSERTRAVIRDELERDPRLEGFGYAHIFDQGVVISDAIANLRSSALQGAAFAVVVLFFFFRRAGMTLLVTLSIPASLLSTVVVMYFSGRSLNVLSLTGLTLVVGMVVDNSIVVVESIQAYAARGLPPRTAAYRGSAEVALAIIVSTSTSVVVFLPMILMSGNATVSFYLGQIGMPVCVGLVASIFVSLVCIPVAMALGLSDRSVARVPLIERMQSRYGHALRWALARRADAALLTVLVVSSLFVIRPHVPRTDKQEPNINDFRIFIEFLPELSWDERVAVMTRFEDVLWAEREALGIEHLIMRVGGPWGRPQLRAFLTPPEERPTDRDALIARASELLPPLPGVRWSVDWSSEAGATDTLSVQVAGRDSAVLAELAQEAARRIRTLPGVTSVRAESSDAAARELQLSVDRERAIRRGLSPLAVGAVVDFALRGREVEAYRGGGSRMPIVVEGELDAARGIEALSSLRVPSLSGETRLDDLVETAEADGYASIDREEGRTIVSLTIRTTRDDLERLGQEVEQVLGAMSWPRGYGPSLAGRFEGIEADRQEQNFAVLLAVVCVFLLMGVLFESVLLPVSIIVSIPFAFVGVYWALFLTGTPFDTMAGIGVIILVGVVVNNAIVFVDRVEELRREGVVRDEAIALAGEQRVRPILMTAGTTIVGLIPMAIGTSALVGIPYSPLGRAVIGGMIASTGLTLFLVPLFYAALDDLRAWWFGLTRSVAALGRRRGAEGPGRAAR